MNSNLYVATPPTQEEINLWWAIIGLVLACGFLLWVAYLVAGSKGRRRANKRPQTVIVVAKEPLNVPNRNVEVVHLADSTDFQRAQLDDATLRHHARTGTIRRAG